MILKISVNSRLTSYDLPADIHMPPFVDYPIMYFDFIFPYQILNVYLIRTFSTSGYSNICAKSAIVLPFRRIVLI